MPRLSAIPASLLLVALLAADAVARPAGPGNDEAPPSTKGLFIGLGLLAAVLVGIPLVALLRRRRREGPPRLPRVRAPQLEAAAADAGLAVNALRADAEELMRQVQAAWDAADDAALRRLVDPDLLARWERHRAAADKIWATPVAIDGRVDVEYLGLDGERGDGGTRVLVRIQARLEGWAPRASPDPATVRHTPPPLR